MKATTIVALFWLFVVTLVVNLVLNIIAFKSDQRMSGDVVVLQQRLETLTKEFQLFRDSSLMADSLLWNYFNFASFHLPDSIVVLDQVVDISDPLVRQRIETPLFKFYARRDRLVLWWKLYGRYGPIFDSALVETNLPQGFWVMAILEGLMDPVAVSPAKAVGVWQFMRLTGHEYGLYQNHYRDDRKDVHKSTKAATKYLVDLHRMRWLRGTNGDGYANWLLAIAAYNAGPGRVKTATTLERTDNFFQLTSLPPETKSYVPQFIALSYIYSHLELLGLPGTPQYDPLPAVKDTVVTLEQDGVLADLADAANISLDDFMLINTAVEVTKLQAGKYRVKTIAPIGQ